MGLNEIVLTSFSIADLYKNTLVAFPDEKKNIEEKKEDSIKFLGSNQKKILILVKSDDAVFVNDSHLSFLTKLLEACKMNIGDVAIVNVANNPLNIAAIKNELKPKEIILFGISPAMIKLPIDFPVFKLQEYDSITYLCAPPLNELDGNSNEAKVLKSKLWVCLKKLFEI